MAEDLRMFLSGTVRRRNRKILGCGLPPATPSTADKQPPQVVPKGLRSFDAGDADFFLPLLPGPIDRDGLPESVRFWKSRIEQLDPDRTFRVGLLYGPSGCGKSSLVKAALLPRLARHVDSVYVEATRQDTEARLLRGLRRCCTWLPLDLGLVSSVAAIRRGRGSAGHHKVLLVLDQFEQWLHGRRHDEDCELTQALRQCDGERVQCLIMVRDDFWMAVTRFMRQLEVQLVEGENSAAVDLFDTRHAANAYWPSSGRPWPSSREPRWPLADQDAFLDRAIAGLSGKTSWFVCAWPCLPR